MKKILFILKYRESDYDDGNYTNENHTWAFKKGLSSGLLNSAKFVHDMLNTVKGFESKLVQVIDNNCIDREVTAYKPDIVIIEAYWVVPEKFDILTKLHPKVKWIIRNHSNTPFLANEGIAFGWSLEYLDKPNVYLSCNHKKAIKDMRYLVKQVYPHTPEWKIEKRVNYLPNYYPTKFDYVIPKTTKSKNVIDVGCFGAIRPLKNHMIQAIAAIEYAAKTGKYLRFHINGNRIEGNGGPILKNLRETFAKTKNAELVEHTWLQHEDFCKLVSTMDIGLQVSFTETFNIVAADFIVNRVPIVTSNEIDWSNPFLYADPTNIDSIINAMDAALFIKKHFPHYNPNIKGLKKYDADSKKQWIKILSEI